MTMEHIAKHLPTIKHGGGISPRPGQLAVIEGNMNSTLYQNILKENIQSLIICSLQISVQITWIASL